MKRALVEDYASESDSESETWHQAKPELVAANDANPTKKRKVLPALSETFVPQAPIDNPALHQGRIRTVPFVAGQWAAHVYVPVELSPALGRTINDVLTSAKSLCPTLTSLVGTPSASDGQSNTKKAPPEELHISVSRPIYIRAHQREALTKAVRNVAMKCDAFDVSFAALAALDNDELTRTFLVCEIGAGFDQLHALAKALEPIILDIKQEPYYSEPRFHASVGWALLKTQAKDGKLPGENGEEFRTIERFPEGFVETLQDNFGTRLREAVRVGEVRLRIGKEEAAFKMTS